MAKKESLNNATGSALDKFFSQGAVAPQEATESAKPKNATQDTAKAVKQANKKVKEVFSFRAESDTVLMFRAYCNAKYGMTVDQVSESAIVEYMEAHPLEKFERDLYKTRLAEEQEKYKAKKMRE